MFDEASSTQLAPSEPYAQQSESTLQRDPSGMQHRGSSGWGVFGEPGTTVAEPAWQAAHIVVHPDWLTFAGEV
jgi:hypothetical protein